MATVSLTKETFDQTVDGNEIVLIDFWADWCGPCKSFGPIYEKVSENHDDIVFAKVDTDAEQELAQAFGIRSIPTVAAIKDGVVVFSQPGALPESSVEDLVGQVRDLDMEQVRSQMASQEA